MYRPPARGNPLIHESRSEKHIGAGNIKFVFDLKQTVRGGYDPFAMLDAMGDDIVHVHINDWKDGECRLPYAGELDVDRVIDRIESTGYAGKYIIEVYHHNFKDTSEIVRAGDKLAEH